MRISSKLAIAATALLAVAAFAPAAFGACGSATLLPTPGPVFMQGSDQCTYCYAAGGFTRLTTAPGGKFWSLGTGNPTIGSGDDNGAFGPDSWIYGNGFAGYNYGAQLPTFATSWTASGLIDGCINNAGPAGTTCTCMLIEDQFAGVGYFALLSDRSSADLNNFDFSHAGGSVELYPIPKARITNTVRENDDSVTLTIDPVVAGGIYENENCDCGIVAYKVFKQEVGQGDPAPGDRALGSGWVELVGSTPFGTAANVNVACTGDLYIAAQLLMADGFATDLVSANSTKVSCDPNLADPVQIDRPVPGRRPTKPISSGRTR